MSDVSCGENHTLALTNGNLYSWGYGGNSYTFSQGALGLGGTSSAVNPTHVSSLENVVEFSSGA